MPKLCLVFNCPGSSTHDQILKSARLNWKILQMTIGKKSGMDMDMDMKVHEDSSMKRSLWT